MTEMQESNSALKADSSEVGRLKRERNNLETEVSRAKDNAASENRRATKLERELATQQVL